MKQLLFIFASALLLVSCKPTSDIITSKSEAEKRGIYRAPDNSRMASRSKSKAVVKENSNTLYASTNGSYTPSHSSNTHSEAKKADARNLQKHRQIDDRNEDDYVVNADNSSYMVKQLINAAEENLGANYHTGGTTSEGFDCSGLMFSTFRKFDITLPRSSNDMAKIGRKLDNDQIRKGDLIFFRTNGKSVINHVGMVTEVSDDEIKFIHSSTQKGVIISSTKEAYYGRTFAQANRILE